MMTQASIQKPPFMAFPEWFNNEDGKLLAMFNGDLDLLKQAYIEFFTISNSLCQKSLAGELIRRMAHILTDVSNPHDVTLAGLNFTKSQIERLNNDWIGRLAPITSMMAVNDFELHVTIKEGEIADVIGGSDLKDMLTGDVQEDFLYKHHQTQYAFTGFAIAWIQNRKRPQSE